jgi:N-acetylglucosamine kinase-like BadF-type ATPase
MAISPVLLGLECGGTRTVALAADGELRQLARVDAGPANLRLVTDEQLAAHFRALAAQLPPPSAAGVGMADSAELLVGTDPHDANSAQKGYTDLHPALVGGEFAGIVLEWQSVPGKRYVVQRAG